MQQIVPVLKDEGGNFILIMQKLIPAFSVVPVGIYSVKSWNQFKRAFNLTETWLASPLAKKTPVCAFGYGQDI